MAILRCRVWRLLHLYYAMFLTLYVFHVYAFINFECTLLNCSTRTRIEKMLFKCLQSVVGKVAIKSA